MPLTSSPAATTIEIFLILSGWLLIWRLWLSPAARTPHHRTAQLLPWNILPGDFAIAITCVIFGWFGTSLLTNAILSGLTPLKSGAPASTILLGSAGQLGLLLGALAAAQYLRRIAPHSRIQALTDRLAPPAPTPHTAGPALFPAALATALITLAVVIPVHLLWEKILTALQLPTDNQESISLFLQADAPWQTALLSLVAVVIAPVAEEIIFRAGLFRFLRTRVHRALALLVPALVFASLHVNYTTLEGLVTVAPLTALAIVFSLAYERTGRLSVVILAHALFNLHTLVFLLCGLTA